MATREWLIANAVNGALGSFLRSKRLGVDFPLPMTGGRRKTFVGRLTDLPYFELGGIERDGVFIPWEAPRVPIDDVYEVIWVLPGGVLQPSGQFLPVEGSPQMRSDPRVKALLAAARAEDMPASSGIDPTESTDESGDGE